MAMMIMLQLMSGLTRRLLILKSMTTDSAWLFTSVCGANPLRNLENRMKDDEAAGRKQKKVPGLGFRVSVVFIGTRNRMP